MALTERQANIVKQIVMKKGNDDGDRYPHPASITMRTLATAQEAARVKLMIDSGADFEEILGEILGVDANKKLI